jgi:D-serine deaminase-like pyridoxal phosphate-dependent protein
MEKPLIPIPAQAAPALGTPKANLPTPALAIDLEILQANLHEMAAFFQPRPTKLRPHFKTHKCTHIARMQLEAGAIGITCAKLGEAETLVQAGISNILIANQVVDLRKLAHLAELARYARLILAVDQEENLRQVARCACEAGSEIEVLVEVNVGLKRCGVRSKDAALALARLAAGLKGVHFSGVMGYEGHTVFELDATRRRQNVQQAMSILTSAAEHIRQAGLPVEIVSAGGTGTYDLSGDFPGVTEIQAGSYPFMDAKYRQLGLPFRCALTLLATVISTPEPGLAILDAGIKAITTDNGLPEVTSPPGVRLLRLNEEHGILAVDPARSQLRVGEQVELLPSHVCTTVNLHDYYYVLRQDRLEAIWEIEGRGKVQ